MQYSINVLLSQANDRNGFLRIFSPATVYMSNLRFTRDWHNFKHILDSVESQVVQSKGERFLSYETFISPTLNPPDGSKALQLHHVSSTIPYQKQLYTEHPYRIHGPILQLRIQSLVVDLQEGVKNLTRPVTKFICCESEPSVLSSSSETVLNLILVYCFNLVCLEIKTAVSLNSNNSTFPSCPEALFPPTFFQ